ncbi:hypothetical protein SFRURICE_008570 [Spodoptera frugiperda]|nr:hypothetical protein SFRURICE_008570 [Spodoptera frugiperda]
MYTVRVRATAGEEVSGFDSPDGQNEVIRKSVHVNSFMDSKPKNIWNGGSTAGYLAWVDLPHYCQCG